MGSYRAAQTAWSQTGSPQPLQLSLPILSAGEAVQLTVDNIPTWRANLSWQGLIILLAGVALTAWSFRSRESSRRMLIRCVGTLLIALGVLLQGDGAPWFFGLLGLAILLLVVRPAWTALRDTGRWMSRVARDRRAKKEASKNVSSPVAEAGAAASATS